MSLIGERPKADRDGTSSQDDAVKRITASAATAPGASKKESFLAASQVPTQHGPQGIRFDFNAGARVLLPQRDSGEWLVTLRDLDTGNGLFQTKTKGGTVASAKRYYVRFQLQVADVPEGGEPTEIFRHDYDPRDQRVLVQLPIGTLGDTLAWFGYVERFAKASGARVTCSLSGLIRPLLQDEYPELELVTPEEAKERDLPSEVYATYRIGLFFEDHKNVDQPTDFRQVGLHRTAGYILGVSPAEARPRLATPDGGPPIDEPYVCIAVQSSTQCKHWNNPYGWREVIGFLKGAGYRVVCIDQKPIGGAGMLWNHIPHGAEDQTGDRSLAERARWLKHAAFFIGLSSGLSWLAWAAGTPVVLISGFTHPTNEFDTPFRVINWHGCNSCWNDPRLLFDHKDFAWCPRHKGTDRQFECTRLITASHVIATIKQIPVFSDMRQTPDQADQVGSALQSLRSM